MGQPHNPYNNRPTAQMYLIRHGSTSMNSNEAEPERFRAWSNPPLNEDGIRDAHQAGQFMQDKGIKHIFASDLDRAMHTGEIVGQYTGAAVTPVHGLRPWNIGEYTGTPVEQNIKTLVKYQTQHPNEKVPGGESYNEFLTRWKSTFTHLLHISAQHGPIGVVTHTRNINALENEQRGLPPGEKSSLSTGGIMRVDMLGGKLKLTDLDPSRGKPDDPQGKPQE